MNFFKASIIVLSFTFVNGFAQDTTGEGSLNKEYQNTKIRMDKTYQRVKERLDLRQQRDLVQSQAKWQNKTANQCNHECDDPHGQKIRLSCLIDETNKRISFLNNYKKK